MNVSSHNRKLLVTAVTALIAAAPLIVSAQSYTGGNRVAGATQQMSNATPAPSVPADQAQAASGGPGSPVVAKDEPAPDGTGPNPGDRGRVEMQSHAQPWPWTGWGS